LRDFFRLSNRVFGVIISDVIFQVAMSFSVYWGTATLWHQRRSEVFAKGVGSMKGGMGTEVPHIRGPRAG